MKCPCKDCLCVPICRHKKYIQLIKCSILKKFILYPSKLTPINKIKILISIIEPTRWVYRIRNKKIMISMVYKK